MRNSFNLLLIVLAWFDIFFIIIAVLDYSVARGDVIQTLFGVHIYNSYFRFTFLWWFHKFQIMHFSVFEWPFDMESKLYVYMFPRFLYPINNIIFRLAFRIFQKHGFIFHKQSGIFVRCLITRYLCIRKQYPNTRISNSSCCVCHKKSGRPFPTKFVS